MSVWNSFIPIWSWWSRVSALFYSAKGLLKFKTPQAEWDFVHFSPVGEDCIVRSFITCALHQIFLGRSNEGG